MTQMVHAIGDMYVLIPLTECFCLRSGSWNRLPMLKIDIHFLPLRDPFLLKKTNEKVQIFFL